jgi:hypothetical protein
MKPAPMTPTLIVLFSAMESLPFYIVNVFIILLKNAKRGIIRGTMGNSC